MGSKLKERRTAEQLRRRGYSYREIESIVPASRASLSLWLRHIPLTEPQRKRLRQLTLLGQKAGAEARRRQRLSKLEQLKTQVTQEFPLLVQNEFFTFGLALYWAEGSKQKPWNLAQSVAFANSDPLAVLIVRKWFTTFCGVAEKDFGYRLLIHTSADIRRATKEWATILEVPQERLKITLKHNNSHSRHNKFEQYRGLVSIKVYRSTWLNRRIELWIRAVAGTMLKKSVNNPSGKTQFQIWP